MKPPSTIEQTSAKTSTSPHFGRHSLDPNYDRAEGRDVRERWEKSLPDADVSRDTVAMSACAKSWFAGFASEQYLSPK